MNEMKPPQSGFYSADTCRLPDFVALTGQNVRMQDVPHASDAPGNVPVYDMAQLAPKLAAPDTRADLMAEWARILLSGAGVFVLREACPDHDAIDAATEVYDRIIPRERTASAGQRRSLARTARERAPESPGQIQARSPGC